MNGMARSATETSVVSESLPATDEIGALPEDVPATSASTADPLRTESKASKKRSQTKRASGEQVREARARARKRAVCA